LWVFPRFLEGRKEGREGRKGRKEGRKDVIKPAALNTP
jgi:hypothetical protein